MSSIFKLIFTTILSRSTESLEKFLDIDEELPEYETKTGRTRVRKELIGRLQGAHKRGDGLEKISFMLLGPIRYSYTAKEKAKSQGIAHLVYPRFTCAGCSEKDYNGENASE